MYNRSLFNILWEKFLDRVEEYTFFDIFVEASKLIAFGIIILLLVDVPNIMERVAMAVSWENYTPIKVVLAFFLVYYHNLIIGASKMVYNFLKTILPVEEEEKEHGPSYAGIPIIELVDYIFTAPKYARDDFVERFAVPRKVFDDLAASLDRVGVFVRGENNARELSAAFSRADVSAILSRASETGEIRTLIRKVQSGYTHKPSMPEILKRSPAFTIRTLHSAK